MANEETFNLALEALQDPLSPTKRLNAITALLKTIAEEDKQEQGEPVAWFCKERGLVEIDCPAEDDYRFTLGWLPLYTTPQPRKPQFKEFIKWAGSQGYDCAQTCNSDTGEWIALNPMTADLWKAWQAAHGIKGEA